MEFIILATIIGTTLIWQLLKSQRQIGLSRTQEKQGPPAPAQIEPKGIIRTVCSQVNYSRVSLALAIASKESSFKVNAYNPEISERRGNQEDSIGLMGLQFRTAKSFVPEIKSEQDLFDPWLNAKAGVRYLQYLESKYTRKEEYGLDAVIQMYNLGEPRYFDGSRSYAYLNDIKARMLQYV